MNNEYNQKNSQQPANPTPYYDGLELYCDQQGLTKREHFAGLAMQGMIKSMMTQHLEHTAERAVFMADALLKELDK